MVFRVRLCYSRQHELMAEFDRSCARESNDSSESSQVSDPMALKTYYYFIFIILVFFFFFKWKRCYRNYISRRRFRSEPIESATLLCLEGDDLLTLIFHFPMFFTYKYFLYYIILFGFYFNFRRMQISFFSRKSLFSIKSNSCKYINRSNLNVSIMCTKNN